ncbi:FAD:protein FMN transferase [Pinisolibacter aquiterrae]|uniref:FAD:protein FMN transferase n=1 Tax=Pinisolibacter aquiterrae TaxID=2815579 RepID=UPI001C3DB57C|nr:FAD:protein FMN transferase [Pinisolibacter aquiterrae]MBV5265466.1 FAD:protein FMN transferase [Pinisolibacter aquiterrae]MCC8236967.1 FAD:protein FMN transferase [Pinisolibacter aquiterrae]
MSKTSIDPTEPSHRFALNGPTMGSRWSAVFFADAGFDSAGLAARLQAAVERVERQMSTWRPTSDLERLNAAPVGAWIEVPEDLFGVLGAALEIGRLSEGAFDVGVGDLVRAWGFGGGTRTPDGRAIAAIAGRPSFEPPKTLILDPSARRVRKLAPLRIDLSGIAKGFGVDELAREAERSGLSSFLVGIDGELRAAGTKPGGTAWAVGQERPDGKSRDLLGLIELRDAAIATSGNYRHVVEVAGRTLSHTMDPRTGAPLDNDLAAVTVTAPTCMAADAWATALMVRGRREGLALAERLGISAIFVGTDGRVATTM